MDKKGLTHYVCVFAKLDSAENEANKEIAEKVGADGSTIINVKGDAQNLTGEIMAPEKSSEPKEIPEAIKNALMITICKIIENELGYPPSEEMI